MKHYDIVIIGGGAGGISALKNCSRLYPNKSKALIKKERNTLIPCAIPYVYGELGSSQNNLVSNDIISKFNADLICDEVEYIDHRNKVLKLKTSETIEYDKLVLATGSSPIKPAIKGVEKGNIYYVKKEAESIDNLNERIRSSNNIVIVGGGYIGVEYAEHIKDFSPEKNVTIVEVEERCLHHSMDEEFTKEIEDKLKYVGINILKGKSVKAFTRSNNASKVKLSNNNEVDYDLAIVGVGFMPEASLAKNSGIKIGDTQAVWVDSYMRTSAKDVFACGDCAQKYSFFTKKEANAILASIASVEGRIVAENLYENHFSNPGVIGIFSTKIHGKVFSSCGYNLKDVQNEQLGVLIGNAVVTNRHPSNIGGGGKIAVKLIFESKRKILIGAQVSGPQEVSELINMLGVAIERKMNIYDLHMLQVATQPKLTASPVAYPIISACEDALRKDI